MEQQLNYMLDEKREFRISTDDGDETWSFDMDMHTLTRVVFVHEFLRHKVEIQKTFQYVRGVYPQEYNGESKGLFFYMPLENGHLERIRIFVSETYVGGVIRRNVMKNEFDDWENITNWWSQ